ncbi:hypothetical protein Tco_1474771 [Tanacetum coccineum]
MIILAEFMIIASADNHPPMLEKSMYDSWKSRMELYIENRENMRMILNSVQNGPLVWPTIVQEMGLPPDVYAIVSHHKVAKEIWDSVKLLMQGMKLSLQKRECLAVLVFTPRDDLIYCLNKAMAFMSVVAASRQGKSYTGTGNKGNATSSRGNNAGGQAREKMLLVQEQESGQVLDEEQLAFLVDLGIPDGQAAQTTIPNNVAFQTEDLDAYDSNCDDVSTTKAVMMANLSNYGSYVLSEVPHSEPYHNDMDNQMVKKQITPDAITESEWGFEHTKAVSLNEIIPFLKTLQDIFNVFDKDLLNEDIILTVMNSTTIYGDSVNLEMQSRESCDKCFDLDAELLKKQNAYNELLKKYFENNVLKAQLQTKNTTICKLKEHIISMRENDKEKKVKLDIDEIETINIELEHSVPKLLSENELLHKEIEHLKKIYKDQFDSIKKTRACSKEHNDSLIAQLNSKSMEITDLKCQIQEKVFVTTALQNELRRLKCKNVLDNATTITNATTIASGMFKLDIEPISQRLKNNRDAHEDYLKKTIENTDTICGLVERARKQNPSEPLLDSACMFTKHVQELLVYVSKTCPSLTKPSEKLVAVTPLNKNKKVRFTEPVTLQSNTKQQLGYHNTPNSNKPMLTSIKLKSSTSASRSQPSGNTKNNRILRPTNVKHSMLNANSELVCATYNKCMFDAIHDMCVLDLVKDVNVRSKSKSAKNNKKQNIWKPTGKMFTEIGYKWKPTRKLFTLVGNSCPLTRITSTKVVPLKETTSHSVETLKPKLKIYNRRPKLVKSVGLSKKSKIVESRIANNSEPNHSWGSNATDVPSFSYLINDRLSRLFSGIWTPDAQNI